MLGITDLKNNVIFKFDNNPYIVLSSEHSKQGRGGAIMRTRIKNLLNGAIISRTFKGSENFEEVQLERIKAQYLYADNKEFHFMNSQTFDQFTLDESCLGENKNFLKEGQNIDVIVYENKPINIDMPIKIDLKVVYTEPGFKGNTQSATLKPAKLETGAEVQVPLFIKIGDIIKIDTRTGQYVERV